MAARELRGGVAPTPITAGSMASALTVEQAFDSLAIRVDGPKAWDQDLVISWHFTDLAEHHRVNLRNGVLTHTPVTAPAEDADLALTLAKPQLMGMLAGGGLDGIDHTGDPAVLRTLLSVLDEPDPDFAIVTP